MKLATNTRRVGRTRGFSIVEGVIGMLVLGLTSIALVGGLMSGFTTIRMARENQRATQILVNVMELIRLYSWEQINTPGFVPATFVVVDTVSNATSPTLQVAAATTTSGPNNPPTVTPTGVTYTGTIQIADPAISTNYGSQMKLIRVQLSWQTAGIQRNRSLSTLVTYDGLHNYIF